VTVRRTPQRAIPLQRSDESATDQPPAVGQVVRNRRGASCALIGTALLVIGTGLHPASADPNDSVAAFTEYASDHIWVLSHLTQISGLSLIVAALLLLGRQLEKNDGLGATIVGRYLAIVALAIAVILQAVDGIALKRAVDAWAKNPTETALATATTIRHIEIGLASMLELSVGLVVILFGTALCGKHIRKFKLGLLGVAAGSLLIVGGILTAYEGFSGRSMAVAMPANVLLLCWVSAIAIVWAR
jgi:hypothetical protein